MVSASAAPAVQGFAAGTSLVAVTAGGPRPPADCDTLGGGPGMPCRVGSPQVPLVLVLQHFFPGVHHARVLLMALRLRPAHWPWAPPSLCTWPSVWTGRPSGARGQALGACAVQRSGQAAPPPGGRPPYSRQAPNCRARRGGARAASFCCPSRAPRAPGDPTPPWAPTPLFPEGVGVRSSPTASSLRHAAEDERTGGRREVPETTAQWLLCRIEWSSPFFEFPDAAPGLKPFVQGPPLGGVRAPGPAGDARGVVWPPPAPHPCRPQEGPSARPQRPCLSPAHKGQSGEGRTPRCPGGHRRCASSHKDFC